MSITSKMTMFLVFALTLAAFQLWGTESRAQSAYFTSRGCVNCHSAPVTSTCAGCHQHSGTLTATANKTSYAPGETVTVTLTASGQRSGWIGARLYNQSGVEVARSTGNQSGMGGSTLYPAVLSAPAPAAAGTYTWKMAYLGNQNGTGTGDVHGEKSVNVTITVAAATPPPDTTAPVVGAFTLPATATSLTVPVSSLSASDNVAVTGYMITKSATAPAASATGWSATAPTSVTAVAGSNTFYAYAKDAAGNISAGKSASVTVTLPDTAAPVVGAFTLPATATSLTVPVSSLTATDNTAVTGYIITTSATAPAASATGWSATAPTSVTAVAGSNTFYAYAKDAAGNVSAAKSATVTVTIAPADLTLTVSTLADGSYTNKGTLNVTGTVGGAASLTVNGQAVAVNADGSFSTALTLQAGANTITVIATDNAGTQKTDTRTITYDPTAPVLTVSSPADNSTTTQSFITLTGTISENSTVKMSVNGGTPQSAAITGNTYSATVYLVAGVNTISITAADLAGNTATAKRTVTYTTGSSNLGLAVTYPSQDITTRYPYITIRGKVAEGYDDDDDDVRVKITVNGRTYYPEVDDGEFRQRIYFTYPKLYAITVTAKDDAGNSSTVVRNVIYRPGYRSYDRDDD
jgi:hypothetical protein